LQSDRFARKIVAFLMPSLAARSRRLNANPFPPTFMWFWRDAYFQTLKDVAAEASASGIADIDKARLAMKLHRFEITNGSLHS
jgi:hypothetical protein